VRAVKRITIIPRYIMFGTLGLLLFSVSTQAALLQNYNEPEPIQHHLADDALATLPRTPAAERQGATVLNSRALADDALAKLPPASRPHLVSNVPVTIPAASAKTSQLVNDALSTLHVMPQKTKPPAILLSPLSAVRRTPPPIAPLTPTIQPAQLAQTAVHDNDARRTLYATSNAQPHAILITPLSAVRRTQPPIAPLTPTIQPTQLAHIPASTIQLAVAEPVLKPVAEIQTPAITVTAAPPVAPTPHITIQDAPMEQSKPASIPATVVTKVLPAAIIPSAPQPDFDRPKNPASSIQATALPVITIPHAPAPATITPVSLTPIAMLSNFQVDAKTIIPTITPAPQSKAPDDKVASFAIVSTPAPANDKITRKKINGRTITNGALAALPHTEKQTKPEAPLQFNQLAVADKQEGTPASTSKTDSVEAQPSPASALTKPNEHDDKPHDLKQELWQEWNEKLGLLEQENIALRDKASKNKEDPLRDIRVDAVAAIKEQVLRDRIVELEKELLAQQTKAKENTLSEAAKNAAANAMSPSGKLPPPLSGKDLPLKP
jgi:hypothetical protein